MMPPDVRTHACTQIPMQICTYNHKKATHINNRTHSNKCELHLAHILQNDIEVFLMVSDPVYYAINHGSNSRRSRLGMNCSLFVRGTVNQAEILRQLIKEDIMCCLSNLKNAEKLLAHSGKLHFADPCCGKRFPTEVLLRINRVA